MAQELNRGRDRYVQVDKFEDYELTLCIAYKLAIRNMNVIEILFSLDKIKKIKIKVNKKEKTKDKINKIKKKKKKPKNEITLNQ